MHHNSIWGAKPPRGGGTGVQPVQHDQRLKTVWYFESSWGCCCRYSSQRKSGCKSECFQFNIFGLLSRKRRRTHALFAQF